MSAIAIVRLLLSIVSYIVKYVGDEQQRKIGEDRVIKQQLLDLAVRTNVAKQIDMAADGWSRDDIDNILQRYYRNEGTSEGSNQ